ncbi:MAG TPA: hypothetical protein VL551_34710 [Actinospica sp.]|nr:hypothetical protein [Actinospica sp.]
MTTEAEALAELHGALIASTAGHAAAARRHLELAGAPGGAGYAEHRALAFVHQWCFLIEEPPTDPALLRELIGDPVSMRMSDGRVLTEYAEIATWHDATANAVETTTHTLVEWKLTRPEPGRYDVALDFAWQGITAARQPMTARTHHEWTLTDADEHFPRLASFVVTAVRPFAPATAVDALADLRGSSPAA